MHAPRTPVLLLALLLALAPASGAQESPLPPADSAAIPAPVAEGWADGRRLAGRPGTGGYFLGSFLLGLPVGFFGLVAAFDGDAVPTMFVLGGAAGIVGTAVQAQRSPVRIPQNLERRVQERDTEYQRAFNEAYTNRLRGRRRSSAVLGGLAGTAAGFGLLLHLLSNSFT